MSKIKSQINFSIYPVNALYYKRIEIFTKKVLLIISEIMDGQSRDNEIRDIHIDQLTLRDIRSWSSQIYGKIIGR